MMKTTYKLYTKRKLLANLLCIPQDSVLRIHTHINVYPYNIYHLVFLHINGIILNTLFRSLFFSQQYILENFPCLQYFTTSFFKPMHNTQCRNIIVCFTVFILIVISVLPVVTNRHLSTQARWGLQRCLEIQMSCREWSHVHALLMILS